jgi:ribonuclease VapC
MIVLDASALLAFLFDEPGRAQVAAEIGSSCISTVNLAEVIGKFVQRGIDGRLVLQQIAASTVEIVPFSSEEAALAASLVPCCKPLGLSLADRACLSLALARGLPVLTADRAWGEVDVGVQIDVVHR